MKNTTAELETRTFSLYKVTEGGGVTQKEAVDMLRGLGLEAEKCHSIYMGHFGVRATGTREQLDAAEELLFG